MIKSKLISLVLFTLPVIVYPQSCFQLTIEAIDNGALKVTGISDATSTALYTYDNSSQHYTLHCLNNCTAEVIVLPNPEDDILLVYENGLYCRSENIQTLQNDIDKCTITIINDFCKSIDVYAEESNRFLGTLAGKSHPFSPPPYFEGEQLTDPVKLSPGASRIYQIFNEDRNMSNAIHSGHFI